MTSRVKFIVFCGVIFFAVFSHAQDIYTASYRGDLETVKKLLEENPELIDSRNSVGRFPLEMAAQTGQTEVVKFLLDKGADVNLNRGGATALHMAAIYGGNTKVITLLLEAGADINARTENGDTPLNMAVYGKQKAIAELLLDKGAEINLEDKNFSSLLYTAASGGIKEIADMAMEKEVDFSFRTGNGDTLLHAASEGGLVELVRSLLEKGADMDAADIYGQSPLHVAARGAHLDVVELFLKKGAEVDVKTENGKTPLHFAREKEHEEVVAYLIENGADAAEWAFPRLKGKYLDQTPPGKDPLIFSPGIVSTREHFEHSILAFSPDYSEVFWSSDFTEFGFYDIVTMKNESDGWSAPRLAPFSEKHHAGSPVFSHDGKKLYFSSARPRPGEEGNSDTNIWVVEKTGKGWSEPKLLDDIINSSQGESVQSISLEGTLYFRRGMEMFRSKQKDGIFLAPEKLDIQLSPGARVFALFIAPDESYMILESFGGEGGYGGADLYISYKMKDSSWCDPVNLGPKINTGATERFPSVTPDGKYLLFLRVSDGSDFYWVSSKIIEELKPEELNLTQRDNFPVHERPYFGQEPPGMTVEVFAPGIVSTGHGEFCSLFSHDGKEFYWSLTGAPYPVIVAVRQDHGRWTQPEIASFSGKYLDYDMAFSPDGKRLFFCSRRPLDGNGPPTDNTDIWYVERDGAGWSEPSHLPVPINSDAQEYYPLFSQNGTLYFSSTRPGGYGAADIYRAPYKNGGFLEPENLGPLINTANFEGDLYIAADESYIIVTCYDRPDSFGSGDLYISFRKEDGTWSPLKNMGTAVNTAANEHCPMLSPDGKYLFFSSGRSRHPGYSKTAITYREKIEMMNSWGNGRNEDIYWIDAKIIHALKPDELR